ncbi:Mitochondrial substrate/solute carrier [Penicillium longicatenatum]|uniref:Mitochondrial substrate/solute carrier n=1 Tax=Penicillium longicatenatum TaxID=1561947 RepID=UPI0025492715|nr:Mitochondrial substrate/solute carrier [Penicillium longicatenatum]KAJ5650772.1 Mitochondrial substrate/solute carrier [Penicillium longicatenatum]KAJ5671664.1 Mitochondrial substrate/solute carrier [Penicillium longicatenatum]
MAEYKLTYESQLDAFHPSYRWESHSPSEDWKAKALRGPALPVLGNAVAGAVGSAVSNVVVYPLSVIVARLQTQQRAKGKKDDDSIEEEEYTSILDAAYKIYLDQGLAGLYPGLAQDTCKSILDSFLFFLAYTTVRQRRIAARLGPARAAKTKNIVLPILDELVIGIVAGAFSKLFTTPLSNIVTRKQTAARKGSSGNDPSTADIAAQIKKEKGLAGFWSGYSASLILTLNPSITLFLNEVFKRALLPRAKRDKPSAVVTFLMAALSKSVASSITYPFSLAKTRAQAMAGESQKPGQGKTILSALMPQIVYNVIAIARAEGIPALYAGLPGEVLKGFFSHGFTMLAKDAVYGSIVKSYYIILTLLRRYPSPEELLVRAREQAEEYSEVALEGARDLAERAKEGAEEVLNNHSGNVAVDATSNAAAAAGHGVDASSGLKISPVAEEINETAELVGDYVQDEAAEWKSFYHWFWEKDRGHKV